jgi:alpha/beta superfamily hydrolase
MPEIKIEQGNIADEGYLPITIFTARGRIECRYYKSAEARSAALFVGGVGGDFDTPAMGLYPRLCDELMSEGISSLRVRFRHPTSLVESVLDLLTGIEFIRSEGISLAGLIGHSFGGAVVIQAAASSDLVRTVVTLATQCLGADAVSRLRPETSILLIHGTSDPVLTPRCSSTTYDTAHEPKQIKLYKGAGHGLDEVAEEVHEEVLGWVLRYLK